eukprot:Rmarinus@m.25845
MNVTRDNFLDVCEEINALLPTCSFVAIDEEMTGIGNPREMTILDSLQSRYSKMREVASRFHIIQVGMALFHSNDDGKGFTVRPYNFYLFPETGEITLEASAIAFLKKNGMDFNKWMYQGIPFVGEARERDIRSDYFGDELPGEAKKEDGDGEPQTGVKKTSRKKAVATRTDDCTFVKKCMQSINEWIENGHVDKEFTTPECNGFLRRLLYQELEDDKYNSYYIEKKSGSNDRVASLVICNFTPEEKKEWDKERAEELFQSYKMKVGFRSVFDALSKAKCPIVGHHCLYDLLFLYNHLHAKLPETLVEFKTKLKELFPVVYDTKHLAMLADMGSLALESLHAAVKERFPQIQIEFAPGFDMYKSSTAAHEAAYDAYITGIAYVHLRQHLSDSLARDALHSLPLQNRMYVMRNIFTLNLEQDEDDVEKGTHLYATWKGGVNVDTVLKKHELDAQTFWCGDNAMAVVVYTEMTEEVRAKLVDNEHDIEFSSLVDKINGTDRGDSQLESPSVKKRKLGRDPDAMETG